MELSFQWRWMVWGEGENVFAAAFPAAKTAEHIAVLL